MSEIRNRIKNLNNEIYENLLIVEQGLEKYFPKINSVFKDYTLHDKSHLNALEIISDWLIPKSVLNSLNEYELFCLICGLWGHDIGMGATNDEINTFCITNGIVSPNDDNEAQEFFLRRHHAALSENIISSLVKSLNNVTLSGLGRLSI